MLNYLNQKFNQLNVKNLLEIKENLHVKRKNEEKEISKEDLVYKSILRKYKKYTKKESKENSKKLLKISMQRKKKHHKVRKQQKKLKLSNNHFLLQKVSLILNHQLYLPIEVCFLSLFFKKDWDKINMKK